MLSHLQTQRGHSKQQHSHPKWGLKESNQVTAVLTHHALILHIIGREGPELGSCRVHSRLPWIQPMEENKLQKSSWEQTPSTCKCFLLRLCREHTGPAVKRPGFKAQLYHLEGHERDPSLYGNKSHHLLSFVPDTTLNILHTWSNLVLLTTLWGKFLSS